jgi:YVTN family beta-propeller protein
MAHRPRLRTIERLALAGGLLGLVLTGPASATNRLSESEYVPAAARSSASIALTAGGDTLLVVNPDSNSLTLVDTGSLSPIAELPVGIDPRTVTVDDGGRFGQVRAYVANRGSASVSVVDVTAGQVITHVTVAQRPHGAVVGPKGRRLYVAEQGSDTVSVIDTDGFEILETVPVGDRPSGLAITDDGHTLFVTHLLSSTITVLEAPWRIYFPVFFEPAPVFGAGAVIVPTFPRSDVPAPAWSTFARSSVRLWPDSNLVQSVVVSPDGERAYIPHTRSNTSSRALTFDTTVFPLVSLIDVRARRHMVGQQLSLDTIDPPGVGLPFDAAVTPDGAELWVVNAASNDVTVVNLNTRQRAAHIEVGDNPRGVAIAPDGATAYVNNTLAGTVSVIDTAAYLVTDTVTVTQIPLPPVLLNGKRLFHTSDDLRLARDQWISCNTCHFEGEHDGRTWFFGFAGPRNTTSLLGMIETYPLRWSAEWDESADSEFANRKENFGSGLIDGEMNCSLSPADCVNHPPNQGRSYDLDCLASFIDSLQVTLSPTHANGEPLSPAEERGRALFEDAALGCVTCHPAPLYTDLLMHDVGTATGDEKIGPAYDTPTLRGLYDSAPYFHDGSAATLYDALTLPTPGGEHDVTGHLTEGQIQDLIAFLEALPFE